MKNDENLNYVNYILKNKNAEYKGPNSLFKYRKFDENTFDMLGKRYLFLCVAYKLDDKSECTTILDVESLYDEEKDKISKLCVLKIMENIKPVVKKETFDQLLVIINQIMDENGDVGLDSLETLKAEMIKLNPGIDLTPILNKLQSIPDKLDNPIVSEKMKNLINTSRNARKKIGICSLSADSNNNDAWRRYGDNSSGCCIEYDMVGFEPANIVFPVIYENKREKDIILNLIATFMSWVIMSISRNQIQQNVSQFLKLFITKSKKWKRQNEWRILGDANTKIKAPMIKRVIVGKNATKENRLKIAECCKRNNIPLEDQD